jgi:hypothetical protein
MINAVPSSRRGLSAWTMAATVAGTFLACGCGRTLDKWEKQRPKTYPTSGRLLWDGTPEAEVILTFVPKSGGPAAVGFTDAAGRFRLKTYKEGDGAVAGEFDISLTKTVTLDEGDELSRRPPTYLVVTPKKYADVATSGLKATVADTGRNDITVEITGPRAKP